MEFQKELVFTALNADELKIGSKVIAANNISSLKSKVLDEDDILEVKAILEPYCERRFQLNCKGTYSFVYLVSEPEKNWIVYLFRGLSNPEDYCLTACRSDTWESVKKEYGAKTKLFEGTEDKCDKWYTSRRHFANVIAAWEDGKTIQYNTGHGWEDCCDNIPAWDVTSEYRIKPEGLKWTDLKVGDVIRRNDGLRESLVTVIDKDEDTGMHILAGTWLTNRDLEDYYKVDDYWETVNEKD